MRARLAILAALLVGACSFAPPRVETFPSLPLETRLATFDEVWRTVEERYHDPALNGADWPGVRTRLRPAVTAASSAEEFYRLLQRMTGALSDSHTRVNDPRQTLDRIREETVSIGASLAFAGEDIVIAAVEPDSAAASADVRPGDAVLAVDGEAVDAAYGRWREQMGHGPTERANRWRWLRARLSGPAGAPVELVLARGGARAAVRLPRRIVSTALSVRATRLPAGQGLIAFNRFRPPLTEELRRAIEGLGRLTGLILDLRGNFGGAVAELRTATALFPGGPLPIAEAYTRVRGSTDLVRRSDLARADRGPAAWSGPLAVLIDERTASAAELFAAALQEGANAVVVGSPSCGCVLGVRQYRSLPGEGELAVAEIAYRSARGKRLEGAGVTPDIVVAPTREDYADGRDPVLDAARAALAGGPGRWHPGAPAGTDVETAR